MLSASPERCRSQVSIVTTTVERAEVRVNGKRDNAVRSQTT